MKDQSPTVVFEYDSNNYARFGYRAGDLFDLLRRNGYGIWSYNDMTRFYPIDNETLLNGTINLIACKDENCLLQTLDYS